MKQQVELIFVTVSVKTLHVSVQILTQFLEI